MPIRPPEYMLIDLTIGFILSILTILMTRRFRPAKEYRFYAVALAGAAMIYVVFAMRAEVEQARWLGIEGLGLLAFGFIAYLGATRSAWFLVGGWIAHVAWDVAIHGYGTTPFVPAPYPMWCLVYDLVVALYIAVRMRKWPKRAQ